MTNIQKIEVSINLHEDSLQTLHSLRGMAEADFLRNQIKTELAIIRELKSILVGLYLDVLEKTFPQADAIYEDAIIRTIGEDGLYRLKYNKAIQLCACINGRRLYAI